MTRLGFKHNEDSKKKIGAGARGKGRGGFNVRICCPHCGQEMSPANLAKHEAPCIASRGKFLNGKELSVNDLKNLRRVLKVTGWTVDEYLLQYRIQDGRCAICGKPPSRSRLCADHSHTSGTKRELLCDSCNLGIGLFKEDIELLHKVIQYIKKHD